MDYLWWNDNIAVKFFNPEMAGHRVYLHITKELIAALGQQKGVGVPDFLQTVRRGPPWCSGAPLCLRAKEAFSGWRKRKLPVRLPFPPYIGFLGLFVLAAGLGEQGEFAVQAYYPRLRKLLGEADESGPYPYFDEMRELWADLESWSQEDKHGELGIFEYPATGRFVNVGIPISQSILTEQERQNLSSIFADGALDASAPPAGSYLTNVLEEFGTGRLRPRILRILQNPSAHREELEALIETVLEELASWDGTVPDIAATEERGRSVHASLRLCLDEIDEVAGRVVIHVRCRTGHEFPEDGLSIAIRHKTYRCQEYGGGWSSVLEEADSGQPLDAAGLETFSRIAMRELEHGWRFSLPASLVRVFVSGANEGMPGYVEVQQLPTTSFIVLVDESASEVIQKWGESSCLGFRQLDVFEGIPDGSNIYRIERANSDELVRDIYPVLSFPTSERIRLDGGIRSSGNTFFDFAMPRVVVESNAPVDVLCNESTLQRSESGYFELPTAVPDCTRLNIEIRKARTTVARKSILIRAQCQWQSLQVLEWFDGFGIITPQTSSPRIAGAIAVSDSEVPFEGWIEATVPLVLPCRKDLDDSRKDTVSEPVVVELALPPELSHGDLIQLLHEWRDEISAEQVQIEYKTTLASRSGGRELSDGAVLYKSAYLSKDARRFNRALGTFTTLTKGIADPIVVIVARAYLQLAFYRSKRSPKVSTMEIPPLPPAFSRLEVEMRGLAWMCGAEPPVTGWKDGIGFSDLSLLDADRVLADEIRERIQNLSVVEKVRKSEDFVSLIVWQERHS